MESFRMGAACSKIFSTGACHGTDSSGGLVSGQLCGYMVCLECACVGDSAFRTMWGAVHKVCVTGTHEARRLLYSQGDPMVLKYMGL